MTRSPGAWATRHLCYSVLSALIGETEAALRGALVSDIVGYLNCVRGELGGGAKANFIT